MRTPEYVQQEMKSTARELPTGPDAAPGQRFDEETTLSKMTPDSPEWVIDFYQTRDRLRQGFADSSKEFEIDWRARKDALPRLPPVKGGGRLKESVYWLFSAALLAYLLLEIIGR
jgi:hypothetical protein